MTKKLIDIDEQRLEQAKVILGATTMKETVNEALAEVIRMAARVRHAERLATQEDMDLDEATMADAWH